MSFAEIEGREYIFVSAGASGADGNTIPHIQDAVTVYNRVSGDSTHYDTWNRTVLHGVHVHVDHKTAVTDNGLKSAEVYKIRIPADIPEAEKYLPPDQFACCGGYGYWTIQNDDQIVLGECQIEIERPADLKAVFQKRCKVMSWSDNRFGSLPHWRIGGE